jgi:hypothetical protein
MGPDRALNQERFCWRGPAAIAEMDWNDSVSKPRITVLARTSNNLAVSQSLKKEILKRLDWIHLAQNRVQKRVPSPEIDISSIKWTYQSRFRTFI